MVDVEGRGRLDVPSLLLVEDDPDDVEFTLHALKRARVANPVEFAVDGQAALDAIYEDAMSAERRIGLVLLDLCLPKVDGYDVLRHILSDKRTRHTPVLVLSGSGNREDRIRSYKGGAVAFLSKPIDVDDLVRTVRDLHHYRVVFTRVEDLI